MTNVRIRGRVYKNIEAYTDEKLDHILQLIEIQITNYKRNIQNYPPSRMERYGAPFIRTMERSKNAVLAVKNSRIKD